MASFALPVSVVPSGVFPGPPGSSLSIASLGAIVDTGATQGNTFRSFDINGNPGDQVAIIESADNFATDMVLVKVFNAGDLATPIQTIARYYRTYRILGTGTMIVELNDIVSPSAPGTSGIVNGGQAGPLVIGTTDATSMTFETNGTTRALLAANGNTTWGSAAAAETTTLQSGSGGTAITSTGAVTVGASTATSVAIGNQTGAEATTILGGTGGIGIGVPVGGAGFIALQSGTGTSSWQIGAAGTLNIGADANAHTLNFGTGAAAQTVGVGSQNTTSATTINGGTGGIAVGIPIGGAGGVAIQGGTGSSSFIGGAGSTLGINNNALANTTSVGTGAAVKTTNVGSTNTTSITSLFGGSPGVQVGSALLLIAPVAVADGTGTLGSAATTVDISSRLVVTQTTPVILQANMRTLAAPTTATPGRLVVVENATGSTAAFTVGDATLLQGINLQPGQACTFEWSATGWIASGASLQDPIQGAALGAGAATPARAGQITQYTLPAATLGGNQTATIQTTSSRKGDMMIITRLDVTANTYSVIGTTTTFVMPASKLNYAQFRFDGTAWDFVAGGVQ